MAGFLIPSFLADPVATGLGVETNPEGAEVWIDGELAGTSPFELDELTPGEHDVRVTKDGFLPLEERFEISEADVSEPLSFALQPERISLFLESVPSGAAVVINGAKSGTDTARGFRARSRSARDPSWAARLRDLALRRRLAGGARP